MDICIISVLKPPRANGRNIVGQQFPTLSDVTCCVRQLHTLLHVVGVVAQSLEPVKLLATCKRTEQLPTMLGPFARGFSFKVRELNYLSQCVDTTHRVTVVSSLPTLVFVKVVPAISCFTILFILHVCSCIKRKV